jgi:hypothetical protein
VSSRFPFGVSVAELRKTKAMSDAEFIARYGVGAFMVHGRQQQPLTPRKLEDTGPVDLDELAPTGDSILVFLPVKKSDRNQFPFISVGRATNNDLVMIDTTISKFHAFIREENGKLLLTDAGSHNGTSVDSIGVPARGAGPAVELSKQSEVRFGAISTSFLPLSNLRRFLSL